MYPAKNGDAFLLLRETPSHAAILIDGGYASTFNEYILPDLEILSATKRDIDLVVCTHIDADHILGLIEFLKKNGHSESPKIIPIKHVWHNSIRNIYSMESNSLDSEVNELLINICRRGFPAEKNSFQPNEVSAKQGSTLAALLLGGGYKWNMGSGNKSINSEDVLSLNLDDETKIQVIGPKKENLILLQKWWQKELLRLGFDGDAKSGGIFDDAFEFLCAYESLRSSNTPYQISHSADRSLEELYEPDKSITNASSISFILTINNLRLLFLGDAWAEDVFEQLSVLVDCGVSMKFDVIKLPHHGSLHNTSPALLQLIDADKYLISSNGERHGHPDFPLLRAIVDRPADHCRHLYFNYSTEASKKIQKHKSKSGSDFYVHENETDWIDLGSK